MHILILGGISRSLINFRGPLIRAMLAAGHKVTACAGTTEVEVATVLETWGVRFIPVPLARAGMNPLGDLRTFLAIRRIMRQERPDTVLAYTIKPVIWGGLAARSCGVRNVFSLITGLGYAFMDQTADCRLQTADFPENIKPATRNEERRTKNQVLQQRLAGWVAKRLYKVSLKHSQKVFFQNPDDRDAFVELGLVSEEQAVVVSGSGVDVTFYGETEDGGRRSEVGGLKTEDFLEKSKVESRKSKIESTAPLPRNQELSTNNKEQRTSFLLIARLLRDKGICEYADAAAIIKRDYPSAEFHLLGDYDPNPSGLKPTEVDAWVKNGTIIYHGQQPDVRPFLQACSVYVLPSFYREGTPRTVLEAMATGRAIITTDAPGCRETVRLGGGQTADCRLQTADQSKVETDQSHSCDCQSRCSLLPQAACCSQARCARHSRAINKLQFGSNGILVPPRDAEALDEAMRFFIENPDQIAIMGRESRRYAEERYDVRKVNAVMLGEMGMGGKDEG